jgi:hypothetical protein
MNYSISLKKLLSFTVLVLFTISIYSQETKQSPVTQLAYFKVKDENLQAYLAAEKEFKLIHQERVKSEKMLAWMLFEVLTPGGTQVEHNFVTVSLFQNYSKIENFFPDIQEALKKVYPGKTVQDMKNKMNPLRELVRRENQYNTMGFWKDNGQWADFKYVNVSMIKVEEVNESAFEAQFSYWQKAYYWTFLKKARKTGYLSLTKNPKIHVFLALPQIYKTV